MGDGPEEKKLCTDDQENESNSSPAKSSPPPAQSLSPEQKSKMEVNKLKAEMKLMEKKTCGVVVNVGETWFKALQQEFTKPYFTKLCDFIEAERKSQTIFPPIDEVFSFTKVCSINKIKVVILGQDPYHGNKQAHGLCFSVQYGIPPPPSLENMYKELKSDIEGFVHPGHGNLTHWAEQGVLLLNAVLTVRAHNANSHKDKGWEKFTDAIITYLSRNCSGLVFILWGGYAQKKGSIIDKKKHHILAAPHPSPLSVYRGFYGCKHFSKSNELLKKQGLEPIDWKLAKRP